MIANPAFRLLEFGGDHDTPSRAHPPFKLLPVRDEGNEYTVVIGPNGTGKSALLGGIARAAKSDHLRATRSPSRTVAVANLVTDAFPLTHGPANGLYHYMGLRQGTNTVTTGALTAASAAALLSLPLSRASDFDWRSLCERLQMDEPTLTARRARVPQSPAKVSSSRRVNLLRAAEARLAEEFHDADLAAGAKPKSYRDSTTLNVQEVAEGFARVLAEFADELDAATLLRRLPFAIGWRFQLEYPRKPSAGQEVLFSQLLRVVSAARPGALVLIDEPETALHPQWQSNFIPLMRDVVSDYLGMHIVIATHSPFLVGEADSVVSASTEGFNQIFGDFGGLSIDAIVYKVFGASTSGSVFVERDVAILLEYLSDEVSRTLPSPNVIAAAERLRARETTDTDVLTVALAEFDQTVSRRREQST